MPNGRSHLDYDIHFGLHDYAKHDGTSDCKYGCRCWAGPSNSGGPAGIDPLGKCPNNVIGDISQPLQDLDQSQIKDDFINSRIASLLRIKTESIKYQLIISEAKESSNEQLASALRNERQATVRLSRQVTRIKSAIDNLVNDINKS